MLTGTTRIAGAIQYAVIGEFGAGTRRNTDIYRNVFAGDAVDQKIDWHGITPFYVVSGLGHPEDRMLQAFQCFPGAPWITFPQRQGLASIFAGMFEAMWYTLVKPPAEPAARLVYHFYVKAVPLEDERA